jgi:indolepyruvate ferredoxin oxidoreductase beta subunit
VYRGTKAEKKTGEEILTRGAVMQLNILLAGVGGQGILSQAYVICNAALEEGLNFKQAEVHGMAQRGGAVQSNLRISSEPIKSDLIPRGACDLILSVEPMEALRYLDYMNPDGTIVTSIDPFVNIPNYPNLDEIWAEFGKVKNVVPINSESIAKEAGSRQAANMVLLGAAAPYLGLKMDILEKWVANLWKAKGDKIVEMNLKAFRLGLKMARFLKKAADSGLDFNAVKALSDGVPVDSADPESADDWVKLLRETPSDKWAEAIAQKVAATSTVG